MKYVIRFQKTGVICYTSHLDIMKVFKRSFKRAGIRLAYSQGFNPHPKMGFAQPLSLGYESLDEYIEFETVDVAEDGTHLNGDRQVILDKMRALILNELVQTQRVQIGCVIRSCLTPCERSSCLEAYKKKMSI